MKPSHSTALYALIILFGGGATVLGLLYASAKLLFRMIGSFFGSTDRARDIKRGGPGDVTLPPEPSCASG
jgi:hypothetical protein